MHEMSIALSIVDIAAAEAEKADVKAFSQITLEIGSLSGIEIDALVFAMASACKGSVLDKAELKINKIAAKAKCKQCGAEFDVENIFTVCPYCQNYGLEILQGREMKVKSLVVAAT